MAAPQFYDFFVIVDVCCCGDEQDNPEIIEFSWATVDTQQLRLIDLKQQLVKPIKSTISIACSEITGITAGQLATQPMLTNAIREASSYICCLL